MINIKESLIFIVLLAGSNFLGACNPEESGHITVIDSTELRELNHRLQEYQSEHGPGSEDEIDSIYLKDAVRVHLVEAGFDWNTLLTSIPNRVQTENDSLIQDDMVAGEWKRSGEYEYRTVYRNNNGRLWLQIHLKGDSGDAEMNNDFTVLSKEVADSLQLSSLWEEMETTAIQLSDSINRQ